MTDTTGRVVAVTHDPLGDELAADALTGATSLVVEDAADFSEDGGSVLVGGEVLRYLTADDEAGVLTLDPATPLGADAVAGDRVALWDAEAAGVVTDYVAHVAEDGAELNDDSLEATIHHALVPYLPEGIRDGLGEAVLMQRLDGGLFVVDLLGRTPVMDGRMIDPETLPDSGGSDGLAPASSPTPVIRSGIGSLFIIWDETPNADLVTYSVYLSATSGFTPDPSTFVGSSTGLGPLSVRALTDGTPLEPGTTYYAAVIAADADGNAPASAEAAGSPAQVTSADIATNAVKADMIDANAVTAAAVAADAIDGMTITGAILRTAASGQRVQIDSTDGLVGYNAAGEALTSVSPSTGALTAQSASIEGVLSTLDTDGTGIRTAVDPSNDGGSVELLVRDNVVGEVGVWAYDAPSTGGVTVLGGANRVVIQDALLAEPAGAYIDMGDGFGAGTSSIDMAAPNDCSLRSGTEVRLGTYGTGASWVTYSGSITYETGGQYLVYSGGLPNPSFQLSSAGSARFGNHSTSGSSANVYMSPTGFVYRSTSSRRYKTHIRPLEVDPKAILRAEPSSWLDKGNLSRWNLDHEEGVFPLRDVGFIAEQLDEVGLSDFVLFDDEGRPDAIAYDRLTAAIVPLLREQEDRLTTLEKRLAALEQT